jgi:hypothetical protein
VRPSVAVRIAKYVPGFKDCDAEIVTLTVDSPPVGGETEFPGTLNVRSLGFEVSDSESAKLRLS